MVYSFKFKIIYTDTVNNFKNFTGCTLLLD